eukprot:851127-Pleurochrysis_carterae.AAC.1
MEPMNSPGRVTPWAILTRMLGLRCDRGAVGREESAIAACRACRAAVNKCNSKAAADGEGQSRRVGRRSGCICGDDWHRACDLVGGEEEAR